MDDEIINDDDIVPQEANLTAFFDTTVKEAVPLDITSTVEVVRSVFEADLTRTTQENDVILETQYNDLPESLRPLRMEQEIIFASAKHRLAQMHKESFQNTKMNNTLMVGTNGSYCVALRGGSDSVPLFKEMSGRYEWECMKLSYAHEIEHMVASKNGAETLMKEFAAILKRDSTSHAALQPLVSRLKKLEKTLPDRADPIAIKIMDRPDDGTADSKVTTHLVDPLVLYTQEPSSSSTSTSTLSSSFDTYHLWFCNTRAGLDVHPRHRDYKFHGDTWKKQKNIEFRCSIGCIPVVAMNQTHLVAIYRPPESPYRLDVFRLYDEARFIKKCTASYVIKFDEQYFGEESLITMTLSTLGICAIAMGSAIMVIDLKEQQTFKTMTNSSSLNISQPITVVHNNTPHCQRTVSCARVSHVPDAPNDYGLLGFGTSMGESIIIDWKTGDIVTSQRSPACEPVFDVVYSNNRHINLSIRAVWGIFTPYFAGSTAASPIKQSAPALTYRRASRLFGMTIYGQHIYAVDKYGSVIVWTCSLDGTVNPFKPPEYLYGKDIERHQLSYQAVHTDGERLTILYPNGLGRVFAILPRLARQIRDVSDKTKGRSTTSVFHQTIIAENEAKAARRKEKKLVAHKTKEKTVKQKADVEGKAAHRKAIKVAITEAKKNKKKKLKSAAEPQKEGEEVQGEEIQGEEPQKGEPKVELTEGQKLETLHQLFFERKLGSIVESPALKEKVLLVARMATVVFEQRMVDICRLLERSDVTNMITTHQTQDAIQQHVDKTVSDYCTKLKERRKKKEEINE